MVKKLMVIVIFCSFIIFTGCAKELTSEKYIAHTKQNISLHISKPEGQNYTVYKKIEDNETVTTVMDILLNVPWENEKVSMSREPDYKIRTVNLDPTVSYEPLTYAVWLSPNKDILEIIIEGQSKYGKVETDDALKLLSILETP